jgi:hypothetical protein
VCGDLIGTCAEGVTARRCRLGLMHGWMGLWRGVVVRWGRKVGSYGDKGVMEVRQNNEDGHIHTNDRDNQQNPANNKQSRILIRGRIAPSQVWDVMNVET